MLRRLYRTPSALWGRRGAMLRGPTSRTLSNLRLCWRACHLSPRGMRTRRYLLTLVLPRRTKTKSQLARPTGVAARGGAVARETGAAVTVNAAITGGQCASAIVKDAGLTIWRGREAEAAIGDWFHRSRKALRFQRAAWRVTLAMARGARAAQAPPALH